MTLGQRIEERRKVIGITQAELARRCGMRQSTLNSLINGDSRSSRSIVPLARELGTSPAYLVGEIDDPDEGAAPPPLMPTRELVMMPVSLPTEAALTSAYAALLAASRSMSEDELARELAKRLPMLLRVATAALPIEPFADDEVPREPLQARAAAHPVEKRARRNT